MAARKKGGDAPPAEQPATATTEAPTSPGSPAAGGNGETRKPAMSWALSSDRTTRIEIAAWLNTYKGQGGEEYEQVSFTVSRNYRTDEGWHKNHSWRAHDVPILQHLLAEAHAWALRRRTTVHANGEEIPF